MRVLIIALALCTLSFFAGVAGDLSLASPPAIEHGAVVSVDIPPNAIRARPLQPLATPVAEAATIHPVAYVAPATRPAPSARIAAATAPVERAKERPAPVRTAAKAKPERERKDEPLIAPTKTDA